MRTFCFFAFLLFAGMADAASLTIYDGQLENGFADYYSWANAGSYSFANASPVHGSDSHSFSFTPTNYGGVRMRSGGTSTTLTTYPLSAYSSLTFWVNGGSGGGQLINLNIQLVDQATGATADYGALDIGSYTSGGSITAGTWKQVTINLDTANLVYGNFNTLQFQANTNGTQPKVYFGTIVFNARTTAIASGAAVNVSVDTSTLGNAIDSRIFGVAYGDATRNGQIGYTVRRWGGNSTTRYNWQVDVHNTANDYYFQNIVDGSGNGLPANSTADQFISEARAGGAQPLLTIPTINYTPVGVRQKKWAFSIAKYGPQLGNECDQPGSASYCTADSGNGECDPAVNQTGYCAANAGGNPAGYIVDNDPADTSIAAPSSFEAQWIAHLQSTFGTAANGGVKLYALDNEVMLWNSTHRDVHPVPPTYDEIWGKAQTYGKAIKTQDANALVTGPVTWGYPDLFTSAQDAATCNCLEGGADRRAHGDVPFVAWYLQQNAANPLSAGKYIIDFLDLHYYPQGTNVALSNDDSPTTAGLRLRSLKELYNPNWVSESYIGNLGDSDSYHYDKPDLIPRVKAWISQYSPGTKLAITEYNWGNDDTTSGAVAQAEILAIFAREGVDMATRWIAPLNGSVAENGFSIFLNYDGAGSKVQGNSVSATSSNVDLVGAYAFFVAGSRTMVLLTNKDTQSHSVSLSFNATHNTSWKLYGFSGSSALAQTGSGTINGTSLTLSALPPMSASLLVIAEAATTPPTSAKYVPLVPARLLDTRSVGTTIDSQYAGNGALAGSAQLDLSVLGRGGVPTSQVSAVVVNITATNPAAAGYVTVWPTGGALPYASNVNFVAGQTIPNLVVAKVGSNGQISLLDGSTGSVDLIADVVGYFTTNSALTPLTPARLLDTRSGATTIDGQFAAKGALAAGGQVNLTIAGRDGLPASGVGAVILNVTATNPTAPGYITAWPTNLAQPLASSLNFVARQTIPNLVISGVSANGQISLYNSAGSTDLVADLMGWFPTSSELTALQPARLLDTRPGATTIDGQFEASNAIASGATLNLQVTGRGGVPSSGVGAVILNTTVTAPTGYGDLRVWPTGSTLPNASNLNFVPGQTIANLVIAKVGTSGQVSIYNEGGSTQVIADVVGWFPTVP